MTVSNEIKQRIEKLAAQALIRNHLFQNANVGRVAPETVLKYLSGLHYLVEHTPIHLKRALIRAKDVKNPELIAYFDQKIGDEDGHSEWSAEDMRSIRDHHRIETSVDVPDSMRDLVSYVAHLVETDLIKYIVYIFVAEYFTVLVGPEFLQNLEDKCGISQDSMSVIGNHVVLDKDHVVDDCKVLDALLASSDSNELLVVVDDTVKYFNRFCASLVDDRAQARA